MDKHLDDLRIKAGIGRAGLVGDEHNFGLVVFNKEGNVIDPLIGLQLYGEAIVRDCIIEIDTLAHESGDAQKLALSEAMLVIMKKYGIYEW
jgi:hypothetical protein